MKNYKLLLTCALFTVLAGCASAPNTSSTPKMFAAPSGRALIFIYRNGSEGLRETVFPALVTVSVNGYTIGQTADKTFFRLNVKPGTYTITSLAENVAKLTLTVEAGKNYYVQQSISKWSLSPDSTLQLVDENTGHASVFESRIIASNVPDAKLSAPDAPDSAETAASQNQPLTEKLRELQNLKSDGLITEDEFQKKRQQLLEKF